MPRHKRLKPAGDTETSLVWGSARLLIGLQLLLVVLVLVGVHAANLQLRNATLDNLQSHASLQANNMSDRLTQSFSLLQLNLSSLPSDNPDVTLDHDLLRETLLQLQRKLGFVRSLSVMDVGNRLFISTNPANEGRQLELGPTLPEAAMYASGLFRFGVAWHGRDFADGSPFTAETRLQRPDAGFIPVTLVLPEAPHWIFVIAINSDYFINELPAHREPGELVYRMVLDNGSLLFSTAENEQPGSLLLEPSQLAQALQQHSGQHRWNDSQGQEQLGAFHVSNHYPWIIHAQASVDYTLERWRKDSRTLWALSVAFLTVLLLIGGSMTGRLTRNLTKTERLLEHSNLAAMVFMYSSDLIAITDSERKIIAVNEAYEAVTGFSADDVQGKVPDTLNSDAAHAGASYSGLWPSLETVGHWQGEVTEYCKNGQLVNGYLQVNAIYDEYGNVLHYVSVFKDLSQQRKSEATIRKLSQAVEQSPSSIVMTAPDASIEYANPEFLSATGYSYDEVIGANPRILKTNQTPPGTYVDLWSKISTGQDWYGEFTNRRKDGSLFHERCSISPVLDDKGQLTGYLGIKHDITAEKEAEQAMRLAANVMANTAECIIICDDQERIIEVNPAFTRLTGYSSEEVLGRTPEFLGDGDLNHEARADMRITLETRDEWQGEFWNRTRGGKRFASLATVSLLRDDTGKLTHYVSLFSDITESKKKQESLQQQAHFDALTGLPNRSLLNDRLAQFMARSVRHGQQLALCFMDLDGFKQVNDRFGHQGGDELLVCIAGRIKASLRADDTVARLGGDEFVLLLTPVASLAECEQIIQRVLLAVVQPVILSTGHEAHVSGSIGVTLFPNDAGTAEQLLRHADHAMYQAKQNGRNCYVISPKALKAD